MSLSVHKYFQVVDTAFPVPALLFPFGIVLSSVIEGSLGVCLKTSFSLFLNSPEKIILTGSQNKGCGLKLPSVIHSANQM